jgi:hypothetical protein
VNAPSDSVSQTGMHPDAIVPTWPSRSWSGLRLEWEQLDPARGPDGGPPGLGYLEEAAVNVDCLGLGWHAAYGPARREIHDDILH